LKKISNHHPIGEHLNSSSLLGSPLNDATNTSHLSNSHTTAPVIVNNAVYHQYTEKSVTKLAKGTAAPIACEDLNNSFSDDDDIDQNDDISNKKDYDDDDDDVNKYDRPNPFINEMNSNSNPNSNSAAAAVTKINKILTTTKIASSVGGAGTVSNMLTSKTTTTINNNNNINQYDHVDKNSNYDYEDASSDIIDEQIFGTALVIYSFNSGKFRDKIFVCL
jgi:hypothetical protein